MSEWKTQNENIGNFFVTSYGCTALPYVDGLGSGVCACTEINFYPILESRSLESRSGSGSLWKTPRETPSWPLASGDCRGHLACCLMTPICLCFTFFFVCVLNKVSHVLQGHSPDSGTTQVIQDDFTLSSLTWLLYSRILFPKSHNRRFWGIRTWTYLFNLLYWLLQIMPKE